MLRDSALLSFFLPLTRRTCAELGVGDDAIAAYLAEVMAEFARTDRLYRLRAPGGARLESVVEMLGLGPPTPGPAGTRAFHRYVGDFALFMSGLFRSFVERGGYLGYYLAEGARAYARASALAEGEPRAGRVLHRELSVRFEYYAGALDYLRKVRFPGLAGPDPVGAFLREIEGVVAGLARAGRVALLVTQNVDGLHERSGFPPERLVNIHGTDSAVECMACHRRAPRAVAQAAWEAGTAVPRCDCGGPWKPATISFGQQLVAADLERALGAAAACDLFVAAGTSLVVGPVNQMFPVAREAGARTAIVTASETPYDAAADVRIAAPVEQVLPAVRDLLR